MLADWTADERAAALVLLIKEGVEHPSVGPSEHSRERRALRAALRLPDPDINGAWANTLAERWKQLKAIEQLFPQVSTNTTQPMEAAWTRGVRLLGNYLQQRLEELATPMSWQGYRAWAARGETSEATTGGSPFRKASDGAQPFIVNRMIVTVFMAQRNTARRITERVVTAQEDGVEFYLARSFTAGYSLGRTYVPVQALWGCRAEIASIVWPGDPITTRLRFERPLRRDEQAYFASEAMYEAAEPSDGDTRNWVEVDVDTHGIEAGMLAFGDTFPLQGLTIRMRFDETDLPRTAWWYAEETELERYDEPPTGDVRLLPVVGNEICHTFRHVCQPRERYGISYVWT
jgi:hypothetical protein